jgi:hypothetical protein
MLALTLASGWAWARRRHDRHAVALALLIALPMALAAIVSFAWHPIYVSRTFFPAMMLMPIVFAAFLHWRRLWSALIIVALALSLVSFYIDGSHNTRLDYRSMVEANCAPGLPLYATSIPAAFILAANVSRPLTVWAQATDDAGTFTPDDLPAYVFTTAGSPPSGGYCLLAIDQPLTAEGERAYLDELLSGRNVAARMYAISRWHRVTVYQVE